MHTKVKSTIDKALKVVKDKLTESYGNDAQVKFNSLLYALLKICPVDENAEGTSWETAYWELKEIAPFDREKSTDWYQALCQIGVILEGTSSIYHEEGLEGGIKEVYDSEPQEVSKYLTELMGKES